MIRMTPAVSLSMAMAISATAVALTCWTSAIRTCCQIAELQLNTSRACGLFRDQECPDKITEDVSGLADARPAAYGQKDRTVTGSFVCKYKLGKCNGLFGNNLCEYTDHTITCVSSVASGDSCDTSVPGMVSGLREQR